MIAEVAAVFLRLGLTAFGGPAAHVAMMEEEIVRRRKWVTPQRFLDLLGGANLIPGPSSSELAVLLGYERAGFRGLVAAGTCFVLPAAAMSGVIAWAYVRFGALPAAGGVLYGVKPVMIAIVAQALFALVPKAVKSTGLAALGIAALAAAAYGIDTLAVLLVAGAAATTRAIATRGETGSSAFFASFAGAAAATTSAPANVWSIFLVFAKLGAVVFGSGYVLLAFLRADLVEQRHWLDEKQLLDAVAVGQITPGPVFTTATFIGYVVGGVPGAAVATVAIFLPGFAMAAAVRPAITRVRAWPASAAFLDGVNVAAIAIMAIVSAELGRAAIVDGWTAGVAIASAVVLVRWKVNATWVVAAGAIVGSALKVA